MLRAACVAVLLLSGAAAQEVKQVRVAALPAGFAGHCAYDPETKRLWLISYGPPANKTGPSQVLEMDPASGKILATAELPLLGGFGPTVVKDGYLYQPVNQESRIYKIAVGDRARLGKIDATIPIPLVSDLRDPHAPGAEPLKFPFLEVNGIAIAPDGKLLLHAADLGELITLDPGTGKVVQRTPTMKGLGGISSFISTSGAFYVLANLDPDDAAARDKARRFNLRAPEVVPWKRSKVTLFSHRPDAKTVFWILLDGRSGEPLASFEESPSSAFASDVSIAKFAPEGGSYGTFSFMAMGPAGLLTMQWSPSAGSN